MAVERKLVKKIMIKNMDMEYLYGKMGVLMKGNGRMTYSMGKVTLITMMGMNIEEAMLKVYMMVWEFAQFMYVINYIK